MHKGISGNMQLRCIDTHCHLTDPQYEDDRDAVIARAQEAGVGMITVGTELSSSKQAVALAERCEGVWACVGVHPDEVEAAPLSRVQEELRTLAANPRVVAIGECGLDYARLSREEAYRLQLPLFEAQIAVAAALDKPLMLHIRPSERGALDAYHDVIDILRAHKCRHPSLRGNAHFFAADAPTAWAFFDLDFTVSFTGVLTFVQAYQDVARELPRERVLVETDAPYVAPEPHRGKRNEPAFVQLVARTLSRLWGLPEEHTQAQLLRNTCRVFGIEAQDARGGV